MKFRRVERDDVVLALLLCGALAIPIARYIGQGDVIGAMTVILILVFVVGLAYWLGPSIRRYIRTIGGKPPHDQP